MRVGEKVPTGGTSLTLSFFLLLQPAHGGGGDDERANCEGGVPGRAACRWVAEDGEQERRNGRVIN